VANLIKAQGLRSGGRAGRRFDSLAALAEAAKTARALGMAEERFLELRNEAITCMALPDLGPHREWAGFPAGTHNIDFDGALERYARTDLRGGISVRRVADDKELYRLTGLGPGQADPQLSQDGQLLAVLSWDHRLKVWRLAGPEPSPVIEEQDCFAYAFSPDGRQLAIVKGGDGLISLYDLASGQWAPLVRVGSRVHCVAFHPKRRQLGVAGQAAVRIYDLETGSQLASLSPASYLAWHPEGHMLATVNGITIYLWDVATGRQVAKLDGHLDQGISLAFNHGGDLLASRSWEQKLLLWDPRTGKKLLSATALMSTPRFSPDDRLLAGEIVGDRLRMWEVAVGREYRTLARNRVLDKASIQTGTVRSDGRLLAVGENDGFGLWDLRSNKELLFMKGLGRHVLFEPSGSLLTNGPAGLFRWPLQTDPASAELVLASGKLGKGGRAVSETFRRNPVGSQSHLVEPGPQPEPSLASAGAIPTTKRRQGV